MLGNILLAGGAIFAMFFGAGNIVFPPVLGQTWVDAWPSAILGFCLTAVIAPFFALITVVLLDGSSDRFFSPAGKFFALIIQIAIMTVKGPLGIIPRCMTVAYGGFKSIIPDVPATIFCFIGFIIVGFATIKKDKIVPLIGKFLTPIKLGLLVIMIVFCIMHRPEKMDHYLSFSIPSFLNGMSTGCQTNDFQAAIYYSALMMRYFQSTHKTKSQMLMYGFFSSLVTAVLMTVMYIAFVYLGAQYSSSLVNVKPEEVLPKIVELAFGKISAQVYGIVIVVACMTTAISATVVWTQFALGLFKHAKWKYNNILICSIIIAFFVSTFGFSGITSFMKPVLLVIYPILGVLTIVNLIKFFKETKSEKTILSS